MCSRLCVWFGFVFLILFLEMSVFSLREKKKDIQWIGQPVKPGRRKKVFSNSWDSPLIYSSFTAVLLFWFQWLNSAMKGAVFKTQETSVSNQRYWNWSPECKHSWWTVCRAATDPDRFSMNSQTESVYLTNLCHLWTKFLHWVKRLRDRCRLV